jgi:hypothetical protein
MEFANRVSEPHPLAPSSLARRGNEREVEMVSCLAESFDD